MEGATTMAVNFNKDGTFNKVLSGWWDGSQTPSELAVVIETKTGLQEVGARQIVRECDTDKWYVWLDSLISSERGWYDQDGTLKA